MSIIFTLSRKAISDLIIEQEVSSRSNYEKRLTRPYWAGGISGVTIGLGYDLGYQKPSIVEKDLSGILTVHSISKLKVCCGVVGRLSQKYLPIDVIISWDAAQRLFYFTSLKKYIRMAHSVYPNLYKLHPYEQTAIVGLIYNRGAQLKDAPGSDRRFEMKLLIQAINDDDDKRMASIIRQMKRLWDASKQGGLIRRRELEARYIELPDGPIPDSDKLNFEI